MNRRSLFKSLAGIAAAPPPPAPATCASCNHFAPQPSSGSGYPGYCVNPNSPKLTYTYWTAFSDFNPLHSATMQERMSRHRQDIEAVASLCSTRPHRSNPRSPDCT